MRYSQPEIWLKFTEKLRNILYCGFFLFMPFTQALSFNVGFPLKISELALFLLAFDYLVLSKKARLPLQLIYVFSLLFFVITLSVCINLLWHYPYPLRTFETRFGFKGDSISRYVYFILAMLSFFISVDIFLQDRNRYIKMWIYGALAAAIYSWYLFIFSFLKLPVVLLPGMVNPPQTVAAFGREIIRCGTFLEGNMMGLYLILSAALCFYIKKYKAGLFLLLAVFSTVSTLSIVSAFIFLLLFLQRILLRVKNLVYIFPAVLLIGLSVFLFSRTVLYKKYVYEKIFAKTDKVAEVTSYSKADRLFAIKDAWQMGMKNPVWGVGLANYARHYDQYMDKRNIDEEFVKTLIRKDFRVIPNNIYLEIWAESGGIALLVFILFLVMLLYYSRSDTTRALFPALVCMVLCFNAYPSFIMIYLWCFMALPVADHIIRKTGGQQDLPIHKI